MRRIILIQEPYIKEIEAFIGTTNKPDSKSFPNSEKTFPYQNYQDLSKKMQSKTTNAGCQNRFPGVAAYSRGFDHSRKCPDLLDRGKGAYVWDMQDNCFMDYGMGLRSATLGYS